ncbi:transposase [Proteiniclasticum sp. QWL-01]|uniref:IS110 family transposase n=1 Tax=Proteiniclasticum sp. QWL-01 TaxID=3036945 RepID=UPI00240FE222|nr:transposase [Proteiniclasticum sp. QWL-01]WFF72981.1 transposase [Proteiniclasticum sp. QWL-01]
MFYLGIDIGKNNHEAGFIREDGSHVGKSLRFTNTQEGFEKLTQLIQDRLPQDETFCIGMEPTFPNSVTMKNPRSVENQWFLALFS